MKWSDGQPATAADVVFSYNYLLKAPKGVTGNGLPQHRARRRRERDRDGSAHRRRQDEPAAAAPDPGVRADHPGAHLEGSSVRQDVGVLQQADRRPPGRGDGPVPGGRVANRLVRPVRAQPRVPGPQGRGRRSDPPLLQERRRDGPGPQEQADRLRPERQPRPVGSPARISRISSPSRGRPATSTNSASTATRSRSRAVELPPRRRRTRRSGRP